MMMSPTPLGLTTPGPEQSVADVFSVTGPFASCELIVTAEVASIVKSHAASADMADAVSNRKRDTLTVRTTQQGIRLDILNAVVSLQGSVEQLKLAKLARDFAQKNLDAENKKYELGTDINQNVILAQNALVQAESNVVVNQIGLRRNLLTVLTKTGELLDERGIVIQP